MTIAKSNSWGIKKILLFGMGSSVVIMLAILFTMQKTSDRFFVTLQNLLQPQPTKLQTADSALLLKQVQNMQQLTTTTYTMETIVPTWADRTLGKDWTIATTKLLYLATGEVKAGIDLSKLTTEDIRVNQDTITISLPPAEILDSKIDVNNSEVYHYDRGFLNLGPDVAPQLQTLAQQKTLNKIVTTACDRGILTTANRQAQTAIGQFLTLTNNKEIQVEIDARDSHSCDRFAPTTTFSNPSTKLSALKN